ncbi:MAG: chitobiase/beta-hexosaminidase C-terminal domain-containing protein [Roseburia sp.]|nr:chitobiase/beta-hexosaminidase C-terminal domain-containing protein [Roseburia sp.]MCM1242630.1 chitobiase/beta-hexosaminidase C-terminal domain-containing protein [Roseburia sp.]
MKCPNCGEEMKEGQLICEACGNEIQIVPDFEPEIEEEMENSITETLSTLVALQDEEEGTDAEKEVLEKPAVTEPKPPAPKGLAGRFERPGEDEDDRRERSRVMGFVLTAAIIFMIFLSTYLLYERHVQTSAYQIEKAQEYAERGEYREAIACLDLAYEKDDSQAEILFLKADYYYLLSDNENALHTLREIIDKGVYPYEDVEEAYDKMVTIYANEQRYEEINDLLLACGEDTIVNMFQGYLAKEPEFSYVEGDYAEVIPLKLSSNTSGTIYYTMDGSLPDERSEIYTAPLFLEGGEYTISAFFVNDYGIKSEVVSKTYHISVDVPNAPEVNLYSGEYTESMMISVTGQEGCKIFYTTDDSEPTADSVPYTGPIPMPLGTTNFKFVNVTPEGVSSDVTMRTYTLTLHGAISTDEAVNRLVSRLVETNYLLDRNGNTQLQSGTYSYQFSSVLPVGEETYFTINEYYDDGTGILNRTDKVFLVHIYTGDAARLGYDEKGDFTAVPL